MKKTTLANVSLALAPLPALLWFVAVASAMGEPPQGRSPEEMHAVKIITDCILVATLILLLACGWLAGRSYPEAPRRALAAPVICLALMFAAWNF